MNNLKSPGEEPLPVPPQKIGVYLTPFEWHYVLNKFEVLMRIANIDQDNTKLLYSKIGQQLAGHEVIDLSEKEPEPKPESVPEPKKIIEDKKPISVFQRLFR
jgi:hypothetical protein